MLFMENAPSGNRLYTTETPLLTNVYLRAVGPFGNCPQLKVGRV
jgi:hypothetical protein